MLNESVPARALLAVLPDRAAADAVATQLTERGIAPAAIRIDAARDEVTSLEAEVQEEVTQSVAHPTVGVAYPKEAARAGIRLIPPITIAGAVLGALVTLPFEMGDISLGLRAVIGAVVGAVMFSAIGAVVVPAMSVKNPQDPSVAHTGVTLRVEDASQTTLDTLLAARPLRLDRLGAEDRPLDTVATEDDFDGTGVVEEVADNFRREAQAAPEDKTR